jgi:hypothetical protein
MTPDGTTALRRSLPVLVGGGFRIVSAVDDVRREDIVAEVAERTQAWLSGATHEYPDGFDVGTVGVALDLHFPDGTAAVGYVCSDGREWVHAGLFRAAAREAEAGGGSAGEHPVT